MNIIYFDNAATTKIYEEALNEYMVVSKSLYENSSALHIGGINAEREIEKNRKIIAQSFGVRQDEIIFTSGGTEGNNMAILGVCYANQRSGRHIITTSIEHHSVLNTCKYLEKNGFDVTYINPDKNGKINVLDVKNAIREDTILVSIMLSNNETGVVQPVNEIKDVCKNITFHTDAVQGFGKCNLKDVKADLITVSAHKVHGPKGIGALYVKKGTKINPVIFGGNQDGVLHSGTMNTPAIASFGKAVEIMESNFNKNVKHLKELRQYCVEKLNQIEDCIINGEDCVNVVNASFKDVRGEVLLHSLEKEGIYVSTGSACNSKSTDISYVLKAIGVNREYAEGTIRISFSEFNTFDEIDIFTEKLISILSMLRRFKRR